MPTAFAYRVINEIGTPSFRTSAGTIVNQTFSLKMPYPVTTVKCINETEGLLSLEETVYYAQKDSTSLGVLTNVSWHLN